MLQEGKSDVKVKNDIFQPTRGLEPLALKILQNFDNSLLKQLNINIIFCMYYTNIHLQNLCILSIFGFRKYENVFDSIRKRNRCVFMCM